LIEYEVFHYRHFFSVYATSNSEREDNHVHVCEYLELSIKKGWIGDYLIGYVKAMLSEHYRQRDCPLNRLLN